MTNLFNFEYNNNIVQFFGPFHPQNRFFTILCKLIPISVLAQNRCPNFVSTKKYMPKLDIYMPPKNRRRAPGRRYRSFEPRSGSIDMVLKNIFL